MADRQQPIKTLFLVISDMHGLKKLARDTLNHSVDVVILCGDLSTDSEFEEYKASISFLRTINAPLKIAIAGNHDFTMDIATFRRKVAYVKPPLNPSLVQQVYGYGGEARNLFDRQAGNTFLNEGTHEFQLGNSAILRVYAGPYTPSQVDWGFQYHTGQGHDLIRTQLPSEI